MKKGRIILMAAGLSLSMAFACWATDPTTISGLSDFKASNNVNLDYVDDGNTAPQGYGIDSKHTAGNRVFGSTDSSNIYYQESDDYKGEDLNATGVSTPSAGLTDDNMTTEWTAL